MSSFPSPIPQEYDELGRRIARQYIPWAFPQQQTPPQEGGLPPIKEIPKVTIEPTPMTSTQQEAEALYKSMPQYTPPDRLQRILAAITGGAEGYLSKSPTVGMQAAQEALRAPYKSKLERWQQQVAAIQPRLALEQTQFGRGLEEAKLGVEQGRVLSTAQAALNRFLATIQGQRERERHNREVERIQDMRAKGQINDAEARRKLQELAIKDREQALREKEKTDAARLALSRERVNIAKSKAQQQAQPKKPSPIPLHEVETARRMATERVLHDPEVWRALGGININDYIEPIPHPSDKNTIIGYRLREPGYTFKSGKLVPSKTPIDEKVYRYLQSRIAAAEQEILNQARR